MRFPLRRYAFGALAAGTVAAAALAVPLTSAAPWTPVRFGLADDPAAMLPATVSAASPVTVVTTVQDSSGRPIVTARKATDHATAERLVRDGQQASHAIGVELDAPVHLAVAPTGTDTYRPSQWSLAKINVPAAWQRSTGAGVTVAVIDSGVDAAHPDLAGQVLPGIDYVTGTTGVSSDPNGHGTHVSGTIAALAGNGVGVAGVAPHVKILPIRALDANGSGFMSAVANGLVYAADHGAQVVNMSIGSGSQVGAVTNAISYARSKGLVVVAAAGNNRAGGSPISYPAADAGVIAVASTDSADVYSSFSNRGSYVDIAAPGSSILSTLPVAMSSYAYYSGTSMASPHIAAVAALLKAYNPALSPDQVELAMTSSAVDLGTAGKDVDYGYGRVDAAAALTAAAPVTPTSPPTNTPSPVTPTPSMKPTATTKPTPTPTKPVPATLVVTSNAVSQLVTYGTMTTTTFTVTAKGQAWALQPAQTCIREGTGPVRCTTVSTSSTGTVTVTRAATSHLQVQLKVIATPLSRATTSMTYVYSVRAVATLAKTGAQSMTVAITGAAGQKVEVQRFDGRAWRTVAKYVAAASSVVSGASHGFGYRIVVPKTTSMTGATSNTVQM